MHEDLVPRAREFLHDTGRQTKLKPSVKRLALYRQVPLQYREIADLRGQLAEFKGCPFRYKRPTQHGQFRLPKFIPARKIGHASQARDIPQGCVAEIKGSLDFGLRWIIESLSNSGVS